MIHTHEDGTMGRFEEYVDRLDRYIRENRLTEITVAEASAVLGVSPNYARSILQVLAAKRRWRYVRGAAKLVVEA